MAFTNNGRFLGIIIVCVFVTFTSCKRTDMILFSYIDSTCSEGGQVNLKKALGVDYDTAFLFGECTNGKEIEKALGLPYSHKTFLQDHEYKLILMKNHDVVYDNNFYCEKIEFFFHHTKYHYPKNDTWYCYMWTDTLFTATLKKKRNDAFYLLRPVGD